ncbi:MAG: CoA pyrophosphatase, partial [Pseudonocardia sp.]|nr:CoA pyrophosphatase [Pseudonocardia sp.]
GGGVPMTVLADPVNRVQVGHPSGYVGPAFLAAGLLVWGFTGGLLSALLDLGDWARHWEPSRVLDLDEAWSQARSEI